jgi:F-type H+-transporting ATPase subunit delta
VFHGNRWAAAFVAALGENADAGFSCLKAMILPLKPVSVALYGYSAARRVEALLREASGGNADEYVIRFVALVVEKKQFKNIDIILRKIEDILNKQKRVLSATIESAAPLDSAFEEQLKLHIMEHSEMAEIKLNAVVVPGLLGGYRLRIGGFYIDASLKGQMEQMEADLAGGIKYGEL